MKLCTYITRFLPKLTRHFLPRKERTIEKHENVSVFLKPSFDFRDVSELCLVYSRSELHKTFTSNWYKLSETNVDWTF